MSDSIKVAIKVRPLIKREKDDCLPIQWITQGNSIVSTDPELKKRGDGGFHFDHIFDMDTTNSNVFDTIVKPIVDAAVNGFNGTVFAYGQTSSGKTYTMMGTSEEPGIIPLAIEHMFDAISNSMGREFLLRVSYLEIYNEKVNDLLNRAGVDLKLHEDGSGQVVLKCKEEITNCPENVLSTMKKGDKHRRIGETNMNERSSRSHTIFRITIESREAGADSDGAIQVSQLNLVDLAGSERARQTGATGERFKEGRHINMSLSTLGLVIMQLSESQDGQKHVNFRDSKLTRLLQSSLGGNAMTAIICAITPAALDETQCTLSFAARAKSVKNKPQLNEVMSDAALLKRYAKQMAKLNAELERIKNENRAAEVEEMESKLLEKDRINQLLEERIELLKTKIVCGDTTNPDESFKCKSRRRRTWGGPGTFKQHLPVFQPKSGLPTIKEMSPEKPCRRKSMIQSVDIMNQTFQTAFADFELELLESERDRIDSDSEDEVFVTKRKNGQHVKFKDDVVILKSQLDNSDVTPEKKNASIQTFDQLSPSTPKNVLRKSITELTRNFIELREFTTLEKQLMCQENHCCSHEEGLRKLSDFEKELGIFSETNHVVNGTDANLKETGNTIEKGVRSILGDIPEVKEQLENLKLTDADTLEHILTRLCVKLKESEERNNAEAATNRETMKKYSDLEKKVENITSERNEFEYISRELRTQLTKKTSELELKIISGESATQEAKETIKSLEKQIEVITAEKSKEILPKVAELEKQVEYLTAERNEFEHISRQLQAELTKKTYELESKTNPEMVHEEMTNKMLELEQQITSISTEKASLEKVSEELRAQFNQATSELESKFISEQAANQEAKQKITLLEEQIERLTAQRDQFEHVSHELKTELESKSKIETANKEATEKVSELEKLVENLTTEKTKHEQTVEALRSEYEQRISEYEAKVVSEQAAKREATEKIAELESFIENVTAESTKREQTVEELRSEYEQRISDYEAKLLSEQSAKQEATEKLSALEELVENISAEKTTHQQIAEKLGSEYEQKVLEYEAKIMSAQADKQEVAEKISELERHIENMISEKSKVEQTSEILRSELNQKISELEQHIQNVTADKNQAEQTVIELRSELDESISKVVQENQMKITELEKQIESLTSENNELRSEFKNKPEIETEGMAQKFIELEQQIESLTIEKDKLERHNTELDTEKIPELEKLIESITCDRDKCKEDNIKLRSEIDQKILELNSLFVSEKVASQETHEKVESAENLSEKIAELESKIISVTAIKQEALDKVSELEKQIEHITSERNEFELISTNLRAELKKKIAELELKDERDYVTENANLKKYISDMEDFIKNIKAENKSLEEQLTKQSTLSNSQINDSTADASFVILNLEEDKNKLTEELEMKIHELDEIKNDVQSLKLDIEKLHQTIYLLTTENLEVSEKLTAEKERSKEAEINLQKTIDDLYARISKVTDDKINLESELAITNQQLERIRSKTPEGCNNEEQLIVKYQNKIDKLKAENIELSASIAEKCKELETIKESKSLLFDHECIYKNKVALLTETNESLVTESNELSTDLMDKIEEIDMLKEELEVLKNKLELSLKKDVNSTENDVDQFVSENTLLKGEIVELKTKLMMLSDENAKISNNLMETMDDLDNSRNEKSCNTSLHLASIFDNSIKTDNTVEEILAEENREVLANKIITLQDKITHLTRLNKKLSDLKLTSCTQCAHIKSLNESRRSFKLETKVLNRKLEDLKRKFDRKCADIEVLKLKAGQDLNLSFGDTSLNGSFGEGMNVSFVEERVQHMSNELQSLREDHDKLSVLYMEKCSELEKLDDGMHTDTATANGDAKPKNHSSKSGSRIEKIQKSIDQVKDDIDELKQNNTSFNSVLNKFRNEKASLLHEINMLKSINEELQQKMSDKEILATTATEKAQILETELSTMSKEVEQFAAREKGFESEKLILEVELESLKAQKESQDTLISGLHRTIDELNESLTSLKNELDIVTGQRNELESSTETIERTYREELVSLKKHCEELGKEKDQSVEAEKRATLWAKELENDVEKLQMNLTKQETLYCDLQAKVAQLESLLEESNNEKEYLKENLQAMETKLFTSSDNPQVNYKDEFNSISQKFDEYVKESEMKLEKINETLNKYVSENNNLSGELQKLQDIESKFNEIMVQNERICNDQKSLTNDNKKLINELDGVRECMVKELKSLHYKTLMSKEEEVIKAMRGLYEKEKQKLIEEKRQSADAEKRVTLWAKELEAEIEKLQADLTKRESLQSEHQDKIMQLQHLLKESNHENEALKEKMQVLEEDYNNMHAEFDKQCKADTQQEEAIFVVQKLEKELQDAFKNKESELQAKYKFEKEMYDKRIEDLHCTIESYKTKNMELKGNIEGLEANEKQLRNITEANSIELKKNNQTIHRLSVDLEQITEAYKEANHEVEEKNSRIEEITAILKSKCDMISEYKAKIETVMPDYKLLKEQVNERKISIERYKEEIEELKMEREQQIAIITDKLNTEEIKNAGLTKQLSDLNNKNIALVNELDGLKEKCEELKLANAKLERRIRNSTSKIKAETAMEELKDQNKRLQNNLDGASNRITDLQESKNQILTELVKLKGEFDLLSQDNAEMKKTLSLYASSSNSLSEQDKYDALLQEKNKLALELEGKKLLLSQRDRELEKYASEIRELNEKNQELDNELEDYAAVIRERDSENAKLEDKLFSYLTENKLVCDLEEKVRALGEENDRLQDQIRSLKTSCVDAKQMEDVRLHSEKIVNALRKENLELQGKLTEYENKLELKSNSSGSRCTSPAFESTRRRHSRNEMFNQRRQLDMMDKDLNESDEKCQILRKKIHELELQLVSKNGKIATLEMQIQSENFPYQRKCKDLEEQLLAFRNKNAELTSEKRKLQKAINDVNTWECDVCRRWRVNRRDQGCQTMPNNEIRFCSSNSGVVGDHIKLEKLEKEKGLMKDLCRARSRRIKELENRVQELEEQLNISVLQPIEPSQTRPNHHSTPSIFSDKHFNYEKNLRPAMKENVPANLSELTNPSNHKRYIWNSNQ